MADITPLFETCLQKHGKVRIRTRQYNVQELDEFLKEAYSINSRLVELNSYLRSIRQSYLSVAHPPRRKQLTREESISIRAQDKDRKYLTDQQRTEIDAQAKKLLRELNAAIDTLSETEQQRQAIESQIALKKRARDGLGALGRWAAGGAITAKSPEEEAEEAKANTLKMHREGVIWFLQRRLEECGRVQSEMMEVRLTREMEKSKSILYKNQGARPSDFSTSLDATAMNGHAPKELKKPSYNTLSPTAAVDDKSRIEAEQSLSSEQLQLFEEENQGMLKHYEDTLDQVRNAERSLIEISELQTTLANNLAVQSAHIDQLVQDSSFTEENVGKGNKELKKAAERRSTAQMVFWGTSALCTTLIIWDLIF
ncbi:snare protein syntaxin-like protein 18/UFE1 [Viridothelium virens]|uniref:Snare protein syntaxin-like protein 18/UFE1 n=1 Tax=Viridothelium virens TaxID=1048519 RepID=A0A6A6HDI2_VIRVR|nr:snare protein syntaxin-like protein 18/UFE1 [Viridothelium virens]